MRKTLQPIVVCKYKLVITYVSIVLVLSSKNNIWSSGSREELEAMMSELCGRSSSSTRVMLGLCSAGSSGVWIRGTGEALTQQEHEDCSGLVSTVGRC